MTTQIRRSDYPDYQSYMDAIAEPIGGATNPASTSHRRPSPRRHSAWSRAAICEIRPDDPTDGAD